MQGLNEFAGALGWAVFGQALLTAAVLAAQPAIRTRQLASLAVALVGLAATTVTSLDEPQEVGATIELYGLNIVASSVIAPAFFIHLFGLKERSLRRHALLPGLAGLFAVPAVTLAFIERPATVADVGPVLMLTSVPLVALDIATMGLQVVYMVSATRRVLANPSRSSWSMALVVGLGALLALEIAAMVAGPLGGLSEFGTRLLELPSIVAVATLSVFGLVRATGLVERPAPVVATIDKYLKSPLPPERAQDVAMRALELLERPDVHSDSTLSLPKLASKVGVRPNVLSQALNGAKGISYADAVNSARVRAACVLLSTTELPVVDIAMAVGFNSKSTFHAAFSRHVGRTPAAYRTSPSSVLNSSASAESDGEAR
ncbi:helix-turn-helix domain-containing protein [Oryzibacter oryziterrae]|uniref:helix-turn-helix domain-containing protein n=1 Tax=Oryzibacter oryziterrae TaxID=2766474 RepID=UPI001F36471D|nr:helix-turn-helix transcriptional regulator [Oryzibacter oryziterrae]